MKHILEHAQHFVTNHITQQLGDTFIYHDLPHTERVVAEAYEMARHYEVQGHDFDSLLLACWFHDSGHSMAPAGHEDISVEIMHSFLSNQDIQDFDTATVESLIHATKVDYQPKNILEKIIKDADLHYLGLGDYFIKSDRLRNEWKVVFSQELSDAEWYQNNVSFFEFHRFYTNYAQNKFRPQKDSNLKEIQRRLKTLI